MSADPTLDITALIQPVPNAAAPGGVPLVASLRSELERLRKPAPASADGAPPGQRPAPDFHAIRADAIDALTNTSKDIGLLVRLIEANTRVSGMAGLRDGLALAARLVAECWDWLHPIPKDAEDAGRGNRFKWLNNAADGQAEFPQTVQGLPLVSCGGERFSYFDTLDPARQAELDAALGQCDDKALLVTRQELADADAALTALAKELKTRLGSENAPDLTGNDPLSLGTAMRNCRNFVESVVARRGLANAGGETAGQTSTGGATPTTAARPLDGDSRAALYGQLERIAGALKRIEPHSPVPYLLERCVKLGALPFPELMQALIRDGGVLSELDRLICRQPS